MIEKINHLEKVNDTERSTIKRLNEEINILRNK